MTTTTTMTTTTSSTHSHTLPHLRQYARVSPRLFVEIVLVGIPRRGSNSKTHSRAPTWESGCSGHPLVNTGGFVPGSLNSHCADFLQTAISLHTTPKPRVFARSQRVALLNEIEITWPVRFSPDLHNVSTLLPLLHIDPASSLSCCPVLQEP